MSPLASAGPWETVADAYTTRALPIFEAFARHALMLAPVDHRTRALDVATGPGTLALLAAAAGAAVAAIDISESMLANLRQRARAARLEVDARLGDGQAIPFADETFDRAFALFAVMFFPDRPRGFRELARVVAKGGRVVVASWASSEGALAELSELLQAEVPELLVGRRTQPLESAEECAEALHGAGLHDVTVHTIMSATTSPSPQALWRDMEAYSAPLAVLRGVLGAERWRTVTESMTARAGERLGSGPLRVPVRAHLTVGSK